ncbi:T9SS type A sorting domain-containing protein [Patescibacteria group bacterium]|nr:T9SS type A sorting domain-containing protein [Patescibacteria group bacterium]
MLGFVFLSLMAMNASAQYVLDRSVIGAGHGPSTSDQWMLQASIAQSVIGKSISVVFLVHFGFWDEIDVVSDVDLPQVPFSTTLDQNYPNPFNPLTVIPFAISGTQLQQASLCIYNLRGALVRELTVGPCLPGFYKIQWDGTDHQGSLVATGVYFARLVTNHGTFSRKLLLVK